MSERERLMMAVVEAAYAVALSQRPHQSARVLGPELDALDAALSALDALPSQPQGETVEVKAKVSHSESGNSMRVYGMTIDGGKTWTFDSGPHIARVVANIPLPVVPTIPATIPATVTLPLNTEPQP